MVKTTGQKKNVSWKYQSEVKATLKAGMLVIYGQKKKKTIKVGPLLEKGLSSWGLPGGSDGKASAYNAGDLGLIPGLARSPGEGNPTPVLLPQNSRKNIHFHFIWMLMIKYHKTRRHKNKTK